MKKEFCLFLGLLFSMAIFNSSVVYADRVTEGLWLGPIDAKAGATVSIDKDFLADIGGEDKVSKVANGPEEGQEVKKLELTWEVRKANAADQFNIDVLFGDRSNNTAYFYIYMETKKKLANVDLWLGSDDTLKVWVNGKVVHRYGADRSITVDSDKIQIDLDAGGNSLMAKIGETGGGWMFSINFPKQPSGLNISTVKPKPKAVKPGGKLATTWGDIKY